MVGTQEEKSKGWKEAPTPAWLAWIAAAFLLVGAVALLLATGREYLLALLGFLACAGLIVLVTYIHGNWYVRKAAKLPPKPIERTPNAFMKKCVECGEEIPVASEQCPSCGSKQQ
jgi:hypothetical protein